MRINNLFFVLVTWSITISSYSWWDTGHSLIAYKAEQNLSEVSKKEIRKYLNVSPNIPISIHDNANLPSLDVLYKASNSMALASTWPDSLKEYKWDSNVLKNNYKSIHYIDVSIDLEHYGNTLYCQDQINDSYVQKFVNEDKLNIVSAIKSCIKSLVSHNVSEHDKATALRYLLHLIGDLHQPFHSLSPTWKNIHTHGGNLVKFYESRPYFVSIDSANTEVGVDISFSNLHAYIDGMMGIKNQLPTFLNSKTSPKGYSLWMNNKESYMKYLNRLFLWLPEVRDIESHNIISWTVQSSKLGCSMALDKDFIEYSYPPEKNLIKALLKGEVPSKKYASVIRRQLSLGSIRLAYLLEAIFNPHSGDKTVLLYYNDIVKPIAHDNKISTLSELVKEKEVGIFSRLLAIFK